MVVCLGVSEYASNSVDKSKKANSLCGTEGEFSGIAMSKSQEGLSPGM